MNAVCERKVGEKILEQILKTFEESHRKQITPFSKMFQLASPLMKNEKIFLNNFFNTNWVFNIGTKI